MYDENKIGSKSEETKVENHKHRTPSTFYLNV